LKVEGILRVTGFFELFVGVLLIVYAESHSYVLQCPAFTHPCGPPPDVGLYNTIGLVLVLIGLIQIAASFYIARTHPPAQYAVANSSTGTVRE